MVEASVGPVSTGCLRLRKMTETSRGEKNCRVCPHPYEGVQTKRLSWENAGPPEVARESCWNTSSDITTALDGPKTLIQDAYLLTLVHSSPDGIRVNVYPRNAHQLRVFGWGEAQGIKVNHVQSLPCYDGSLWVRGPKSQEGEFG